MTERKELTAEEKAKPYAKYYYLPSAPPAAHHAEMLKDLKPLDPAKADRIQDVEQPARSPATPRARTATASCPTAAACVALRHPMKGATPEMIDWWFAWHGLEDLRYKLWYPEMHVSARLDPEERAKVLDPARSLPQKFQGLTHHVVEDIGGGVLNAVDISFLTPEDFGFDMSRFQLAECRGARGRQRDRPWRRRPRGRSRSAGGLRPPGAQDRGRHRSAQPLLGGLPDRRQEAGAHAAARACASPRKRPRVSSCTTSRSSPTWRPSCPSSTRSRRAKWHVSRATLSRSPPSPSRIPSIAETIECDVVIVGAGISGTPAAMKAAEMGAQACAYWRRAPPSGPIGRAASPHSGPRLRKRRASNFRKSCARGSCSISGAPPWRSRAGCP